MGNFGFIEVRSSRRLSWKSVLRSTTNCASLGSLGPDTFHRAFLKIQTLTVNLETWIYATSVYDESWIDAQFDSWLKLKIIRFLLCPSEMERVERCRWWLIWNLMRQWEGSEMQGAAHFQSSSNSWLVKDPTGWRSMYPPPYLDNLSTYFTPIRPIPPSSLLRRPSKKSADAFFRSHLYQFPPGGTWKLYLVPVRGKRRVRYDTVWYGMVWYSIVW